MEITELQREMDAAFGHEVELRLVGGYKPLIGKCVDFTKPFDNDPEVASIDIKVPGMSCTYMITEDEIESIKILD